MSTSRRLKADDVNTFRSSIIAPSDALNVILKLNSSSVDAYWMPTPVPSAQPASSSPEKVTPTYPDGLTAREVEVLCLVAQGLTDAYIAQQLIISPRTVNTHLTAIYGKIQVSSRSSATRYAMEHHLL